MARISDKSFMYALTIIEKGQYKAIKRVPMLELKMVTSLDEDYLDIDIQIVLN